MRYSRFCMNWYKKKIQKRYKNNELVCKPDSDANQWGSIQKHAGSRGAAPVGGVGNKAPHQIFFLDLYISEFVLKPECIKMVKYKIDHILKTMNHTRKTHKINNPSQNSSHLFYFCIRMDTIFPIFEGLYLKS